MALTYPQYLELDTLLSLQKPQSPEEHDEMLFVVIHQTYELWFKQILHEMGPLRVALEQGELPRAQAGFKRVLNVMKILVSQVDILETMTPLSFASFRTRLETASGFQSLQFRLIEAALGKRGGDKALARLQSPAKETMRQAYAEPSLYDALLKLLVKKNYAVPAALLNRPLGEMPPESAELQEILLKVYRGSPELANICERFVDLDEGLQEWRYRHVKMAERTIGMKMGTGGSTGIDYLRGTLFQPIFVDLWKIRASF